MTDSANGLLRSAMSDGADANLADDSASAGTDAFSADTASFDDLGGDTQPATVAAPSGKPEETKTPAEEAMVPSWRLREIREERERIAAENAAYVRELQELREFKSRQEATDKPAPDFFEKPDEFVGSQVDRRLSPIEQRLATIADQQFETTAMWSRRMATQAFGQEKLDNAIKAIEADARAGDPYAGQIMGRIQRRQTMDPFGEVMDWYGKTSLSREFQGLDPDAVRKRIRDEALSDPEYLQMAAERLRGEARPVIERPRAAGGSNVASLPSLNRTTAAQDGDEPDSAAGAFRQALRTPRAAR